MADQIDQISETESHFASLTVTPSCQTTMRVFWRDGDTVRSTEAFQARPSEWVDHRLVPEDIHLKEYARVWLGPDGSLRLRGNDDELIQHVEAGHKDILGSLRPVVNR